MGGIKTGVLVLVVECFFFFFNDTATTEIYTLSLHDALPICSEQRRIAAGVSCGRQAGVASSARHCCQRCTCSPGRSEEHTSELQSQSISYAVFCLKKKKQHVRTTRTPLRTSSERR